MAHAGVVPLCPLLLLLLLCASGCNEAASTVNEPLAAKVNVDPTEPPPKTADKVLKRMTDAYQKAQSYEDSGQLRVRYKHDGEAADEQLDFSLALVRPCKLRMHAYEAVVVCDGHKLHAAINDRPGEVLSLDAPEALSLSAIYADPFLEQAVKLIVESLPARLLLDSSPLEPILAGCESPKLLTPADIDDQPCFRVQVKRPDGTLVLWIDQRTSVLRRAEFPTDDFREVLRQNLGDISGVTLVADFKGARLNAPIDEVAFQFDPPGDAELVEQFGARLGAAIHRFTFETLEGEKVTRESLAGKVAVINFWQKDDVEWSFKDLANLDKVRRHYQDQDRVVFLAVNVDPPEVADDDLTTAIAGLKVSLPIARDPRRDAARAFILHAVPTTVVIGPDGKLQDYVVGFHAEQLTALPGKLDKLLAGVDLVDEAQRQAAEAQISKAPIASRSQPERLTLKRLWSCRELQHPGNVLVAGSSRGDRLFVLDGPQTVVELDGEPSPKATHRLDLPERDDALITYLRTATDAAGNRYYLGSAPGVEQLHLFDARWKRLLSFPEKGPHAGISDALLADLDGDGSPEIAAGYWGATGVDVLSLGGRRRWRSGAAENVFRLALTTPDDGKGRGLLAAGLQGTLLPIDADGNAGEPIVDTDRFVRLIFSADLDGDGRFEHCAIAQNKLASELGPDVAVGISADGEALWSYELPAGQHEHPAFEMLTAGRLVAGSGQWVIGGADGSIHILAVDGTLVDRFNYGSALSGLAVADLKGGPALVIATEAGVEAFRLEAGETPSLSAGSARQGKRKR